MKADFRATSGLAALLVAVLIGWMIFQWGFGNDAILPAVAANAFDFADDESTWAAGIGAVAAATVASFIFWALTQAIDVVVVMTGAARLPNTIGHLSERAQEKSWIKPFAEVSTVAKIGLAYGFGASVLCFGDVLATGKPGLRHRKSMAATAVLMSAVSVSCVVGLIATIAMIGTRIPATESAAEVLIRFARNPLTWIVILGTVWLISSRRASDRDDR